MGSNVQSWGLIGTSDIAKTRMIPAIVETGSSINAVLSSSQTRASTFASENGIPLGTSNIQELLDANVDAVYISTTNDLHYTQAVAAIEAGKHVLCEKPLALTVDEAEDMVDRAEAAGVVLATNHHLPGSPLHVAARDLVSSGRIGRVLSARVVHAVKLPDRLRGWRVGTDLPGGGITMDITCHDASVLNPLLGTPQKVTAIEVNQGELGAANDAVMTVIEYADSAGNPILAQTHDAFTVGFGRTSLSVQGSLGSIEILDAMTQEAHGEVRLTTEAGTETVPVDTSSGLYQIVLHDFGKAISGIGKPTASGADGLLAVRVALAAEQSSQSKKTIDI